MLLSLVPRSGDTLRVSPRVERRILGAGWRKKLGNGWAAVGSGPGYYLVTVAAGQVCVAPRPSCSSHHTIIQS